LLGKRDLNTENKVKAHIKEGQDLILNKVNEIAAKNNELARQAGLQNMDYRVENDSDIAYGGNQTMVIGYGQRKGVQGFADVDHVVLKVSDLPTNDPAEHLK